MALYLLAAVTRRGRVYWWSGLSFYTVGFALAQPAIPALSYLLLVRTEKTEQQSTGGDLQTLFYKWILLLSITFLIVISK
ncbi:MAG: hypothetical protein H7Y42_10725 [Chitinophagaceae bacterium]|nr:hypothetical protein [Chitinophagaceae bacterium]